MTLRREPLTAAAGIEISGLDLAQPLAENARREIKQALNRYGAVFFRDQTLTHERQIAFARNFGKLEIHPIVEGLPGAPEIIKVHKPAGARASFGLGWHSDNSFFQAPSLGTVLYAARVPPVGGDTLFANQQAAYDGLSNGMKTLLGGLSAVHAARAAYTSPTALEKYRPGGPMTYRRSPALDAQIEHRAVIRHPETGRKALYLNPMFTRRFKDMTEEESRPLLEFLFAHAVREEFCCRFRWREGSVAFWDNRVVQHAALDDCPDHERLLYRATIAGAPLD